MEAINSQFVDSILELRERERILLFILYRQHGALSVMSLTKILSIVEAHVLAERLEAKQKDELEKILLLKSTNSNKKQDLLRKFIKAEKLGALPHNLTIKQILDAFAEKSLVRKVDSRNAREDAFYFMPFVVRRKMSAIDSEIGMSFFFRKFEANRLKVL